MGVRPDDFVDLFSAFEDQHGRNRPDIILHRDRIVLVDVDLVISNLPSNSFANSSRIGAMALQGPHQGAQKSTRTGVAEASTVDLKVSLVRWVILLDMMPEKLS